MYVCIYIYIYIHTYVPRRGTSDGIRGSSHEPSGGIATTGFRQNDLYSSNIYIFKMCVHMCVYMYIYKHVKMGIDVERKEAINQNSNHEIHSQ